MFDDEYAKTFRGFENELVPLSDAVAFVAISIAKSGSGSERSDRKAGAELYGAIRAGTLTAFGTKRRGSEPEQISVSDLPTYAELFGGSLYGNRPVQPPRFSWRENRERHVRTGEGDVIESESGVRWRNICARRDDLIAAWPQERPQKSSDIERYRVKGSFDAKLWTLDQVVVWAMSRSRDLVEVAVAHPEHGAITALDTWVSFYQSQEKQKGRDIAAELWSVSGLARTQYCFDIHSYLTSLLEQGRLHAFGREPRETAARELSPFDWAGLKIGCSGDTDRLGVWRREQPTRGKGDVLHVRVNRDDVLREFPQIEEREQVGAPAMSDQDLDAWIRAKEVELGKKPPARTWEKCPELRLRGVTKPRFEEALKQIYPNTRKGRPPKSGNCSPSAFGQVSGL